MDATAGRVDRRRFPWAVAFIVAVLGVVAGIVIAVALHRGTPTIRAPHVPPVAGSALQAGDVTFRDVEGAKVPSSPAGPHSTAGGSAIDFDHSPAGAVLAAMNLMYTASSAEGPAVFVPTITNQVVGPDKSALLAATQAEFSTEGIPTPAQIAMIRSQHVGPWAYRVDAYTSSEAAVNVLVRQDINGVPNWTNWSLSVQWSRGDWRLVAPLGGAWQRVIQSLPVVPATYTVIGR